MKRIPSLLTAVLLIVVTVCSFFGGCGEATEENTGAQVTLKVMSWEDYIDDDDYEDEENDIYEGSVVEEFEKYCKETLGKNVKVEYKNQPQQGKLRPRLPVRVHDTKDDKRKHA